MDRWPSPPAWSATSARCDAPTSTTARLTRQTCFVQRQRKVTGSNFAQPLVFSFPADPQGSASRLQSTAAAARLVLARQSLEERFTPQYAEFLRLLLAYATTRMIQLSVAVVLLERFTTVEVLDSSIVALPAELAEVYCDGQSRTTRRGDQAAVKLTVSSDLKTGALRGPGLVDGRAADLAAAPLAQAELFGYNAVGSGLMMSPAELFSIPMMALVGVLLGRRFDARKVIVFGAISDGGGVVLALADEPRG